MENAFDRIQHIFIIKTLRKLRKEFPQGDKEYL